MVQVGAQVAAHPEDAVVHIVVALVREDPKSGELRSEKLGEGSGFIINPSGWVMTAAHVIRVEIPQGARLEISGSIRSREATKSLLEIVPTVALAADAALLRFKPGLAATYPHLCTRREPDVRLRMPISAIGFPLGQDFSVRPGVVTSLSGPMGQIQGNLGLARGMSGGPVLNDKQQVVGIVTSGIPNEASFDYFLPTNLTLALLDAAVTSGIRKVCDDPPANAQASATIERSYSIDETNASHRGATPHTQQYTYTKQADPGMLIEDARFIKTSDARVSDLNVSVAPDRKSVEVRFKLTAGPVFDRWRGWLHGQLVLTMRPARQ